MIIYRQPLEDAVSYFIAMRACFAIAPVRDDACRENFNKAGEYLKKAKEDLADYDSLKQLEK